MDQWFRHHSYGTVRGEQHLSNASRQCLREREQGWRGTPREQTAPRSSVVANGQYEDVMRRSTASTRRHSTSPRPSVGKWRTPSKYVRHTDPSHLEDHEYCLREKLLRQYPHRTPGVHICDCAECERSRSNTKRSSQGRLSSHQLRVLTGSSTVLPRVAKGRTPSPGRRGRFTQMGLHNKLQHHGHSHAVNGPASRETSPSTTRGHSSSLNVSEQQRTYSYASNESPGRLRMRATSPSVNTTTATRTRPTVMQGWTDGADDDVSSSDHANTPPREVAVSHTSGHVTIRAPSPESTESTVHTAYPVQVVQLTTTEPSPPRRVESVREVDDEDLFIIRYDNGDVYHGQIRVEGQLRHGSGTMRYADGGELTGTWDNDRAEGYCERTWRDGRRYEGMWSQGHPNGQGRMVYHDGSLYDGSWQHGSRHGQGELLDVDDSITIGQWERDVLANTLYTIDQSHTYVIDKLTSKATESSIPIFSKILNSRKSIAASASAPRLVAHSDDAPPSTRDSLADTTPQLFGHDNDDDDDDELLQPPSTASSAPPSPVQKASVASSSAPTSPTGKPLDGYEVTRVISEQSIEQSIVTQHHHHHHHHTHDARKGEAQTYLEEYGSLVDVTPERKDELTLPRSPPRSALSPARNISSVSPQSDRSSIGNRDKSADVLENSLFYRMDSNATPPRASPRMSGLSVDGGGLPAENRHHHHTPPRLSPAPERGGQGEDRHPYCGDLLDAAAAPVARRRSSLKETSRPKLPCPLCGVQCLKHWQQRCPKCGTRALAKGILVDAGNNPISKPALY